MQVLLKLYLQNYLFSVSANEFILLLISLCLKWCECGVLPPLGNKHMKLIF